MEKHGLVSFIVHSDYIREHTALKIYQGLLAHLSDWRDAGKPWIALPQDVDRWWRARSQMKLVQQRDPWQVQGAGKERARVAYATLADDNIRYTFDPTV
jgi:hypothetical protein